MTRNKLLAIVRCIRVILTSPKNTLSDKFYKNHLRPILRNPTSFQQWVEWCDQIDFAQLPFFENEKQKLSKEKQLAFHIGQTIHLLKGIEVYTKNHLISLDDQFYDLMNRKNSSDSLDILNSKLRLLTNHIQNLHIKEHDGYIIEFNDERVNYITETTQP